MKFPFFPNKLAVSMGCIAVASAGLATDFGTVTNSTEYWLGNPAITWSAETNGIRTGISWSPTAPEFVQLLVISTKSNAFNEYMLPPTRRVPRLILRDGNGLVVPPSQTNKMDAILPEKLSAKEFPQNQERSLFRGHGVRFNYFFLAKGAPNELPSFLISDVYELKKDFDYTLTVYPVIYKFETNREYLDRVELPSITQRIRVAPAP